MESETLRVRTRASPFASAPAKLSRLHTQLIKTLQQELPGCACAVEPLAAVDSITVTDAAEVSSELLAALRRIAYFTFSFTENTLTLYVSRTQTSRSALALGCIFRIGCAAALWTAGTWLKTLA